MQQSYDDGTKKNFLVGRITLKDLQTEYLFDDYDEKDPAKSPQIRVSIGWRNPQEDAYDITSMAIDFSPEGEIKAACVDGYSNGSISTKFYNPAAVVPYMTQKWNNLNIHNITIKEWTDYVNKVNFDANGENKYKTMQYRIPEL